MNTTSITPCSAIQRWRRWAAGVLAWGLLGSRDASARDDSFRAALVCPQRDDPGRVVCDLSLSTQSANRPLVWVDALVVRTPAFVQPLRSRVTTELPDQGTATAKLPIAFVSRELGQAELTVRARAVTCFRAGATADSARERAQGVPGSCTSHLRELTADMKVGR